MRARQRQTYAKSHLRMQQVEDGREPEKIHLKIMAKPPNR
jgi:hypothetical protein